MATLLKRLACAVVCLTFAGLAEGQSTGDRVDLGGGVTLQALEAQKLSPGRCGLFLWSKSERPVLILFATEQPAQALIRVGGRSKKLARKFTSGERVLGHFEKQTFEADGLSLEVELTYDHTRAIKEGAVIDRGVLRRKDAKGFVSIVPVGGLIGCQGA